MDKSSPSSREIIVRNPATGEKISHHREIDAAALADVIQRARVVQPAWNATPLTARIRHVDAMRAWLVANADRAAEVISACTGKTQIEAFAFDVTPSIFGNAWYCKNAKRHLRPRRIAAGTVLMVNKYSRLYREPLGVVGIISPWNYPLGIPMHEIIPALLAGNTVVFKTAPETIPVGEIIKEMCESADLPAGVFKHAIIDGPVCGEVMLADGGVDKLFFTGSVRVGKLLAEKAAKNLKPISLELGGKDAMVVLADANIERAAHGAVWGGMQNAGQSCAGVERVYVDQRILEPFLNALKTRVEKLRVHGPVSKDSDIGSLTTKRQVETVRDHLQEALDKGARVLVQGESDNNNAQLLPPTVLTDVTHEMKIMREETFGPVIGVMPFDTLEEAVILANDSVYGLSASVWSRNTRQAERVACQLRAGAVTVNDHLMSHGMAETPWGGPGESGNSRGHGVFAFEEVTQPKVVVHDRLGNTPRAYWWYPYDAITLNGLRGAIDLGHGKGFLRRLRGLLHFARGFLKMLRRD